MLGAQPGPPSWPVVFGVIAIVLGALGCLGGCWGAISPLFIGAVIEMAPKDAQAAGLEQFRQWGPWISISSLVSMGVAVFLLICGIGLVQRRRWSVTASRCWAVVKMVLVLASAVFAIMVQQGQFDVLAKQQSLPPGFGGGFFMALGAFSAIVSVVWGWALPVLLLIWLALPKSKSEYAGWR
jgi:hypothetical protein